MEHYKSVGEYCRYFRIKILEMTLKDVANGSNIKTLSHFEHGRSTNLNHIVKYINKCNSYEYREYFMLGLLECMEGLENGK